jgi:DNA-binding NarL/FixJ family response regulator
VETLEPSQAKLEHAKARVDYGAALRRAGEPRNARPHLMEGQRLALECSATGLAAAAERELAATGLRRRSRRLEQGPAALTPRERVIAEMAAAGRSNPEIAQALFVTKKTVEAHLGSAYRKLGISSRAQLPAALR